MHAALCQEIEDAPSLRVITDAPDGVGAATQSCDGDRLGQTFSSGGAYDPGGIQELGVSRLFGYGENCIISKVAQHQDRRFGATGSRDTGASDKIHGQANVLNWQRFAD